MSVLFQVKKFIMRPCSIGYIILIINMFHMGFPTCVKSARKVTQVTR